MEMPTLPAGRQTLAECVERVIQERTCGLIRGLQVEILPHEIILTGRAPTYYAKQLATHAAMNVLDSVRLLTNSIEVR